MSEQWNVHLISRKGREIKKTRWETSKGTNSHYSAFIAVKALPRLHFVLMTKSCFVSIISLSKQYLCTILKPFSCTKEATFAPVLPLFYFRLLLSHQAVRSITVSCVFRACPCDLFTGQAGFQSSRHLSIFKLLFIDCNA